MRETERRAGGWRVVLCAPALLLAGVGDLGADPDRAAIEVRFEMDAPIFGAFGEDDWDAIGDAAESKVTRDAGSYWGFLDWDPGADSDPSAAWIIKLEEVEQDLTSEGETFTDSVIRLRHYGEIGGERFHFEQTDEKETLYAWGSLKPTQQPDSLKEDITRRLDKQLETLVTDWKVEEFTKLIPISDTMIADSEKKRLVVPLRIAELRARTDSILKVILVVQDTDEAHLKLLVASTVNEEGPHKDFVRAKILDYVQEDVILPISEDPWWQEPLADIISHAPDVRVYMLVYEPSLTSTPTTAEGVVLDPDA